MIYMLWPSCLNTWVNFKVTPVSMTGESYRFWFYPVRTEFLKEKIIEGYISTEEFATIKAGFKSTCINRETKKFDPSCLNQWIPMWAEGAGRFLFFPTRIETDSKYVLGWLYVTPASKDTSDISSDCDVFLNVAGNWDTTRGKFEFTQNKQLVSGKLITGSTWGEYLRFEGTLYFDFNTSLWFLDGEWDDPRKKGLFRFYFSGPNKFGGNYGTGNQSVYTNSWNGTRIS
ncbi:hypothetical protein M3699_26515 [Peribacillus simplex]|uniref:hypothetical protein n=1 Tax=Peribacillus simplex TaxID=1478 RepID=UPI002040E38D|nr:hypothetical protein [Peribacillus simplex]MCM3677246.1 hypothetical protein [Peribacillus simplex]